MTFQYIDFSFYNDFFNIDIWSKNGTNSLVYSRPQFYFFLEADHKFYCQGMREISQCYETLYLYIFLVTRFVDIFFSLYVDEMIQVVTKTYIHKSEDWVNLLSIAILTLSVELSLMNQLSKILWDILIQYEK